MTKIVAIIGGVLLMAGVAMAGTVSSLGSSGDRTIGSTLPVASATTTVRQDDRGREAELRGRANEPGEDVRREDRRADRLRIRIADDRGHHHRGRGSDDGGHRERSGDDGGHRGHSGHGGDD
jgi:hypothetical protein